MASVTINNEKCKGCGLCVSVCPKKTLEISKTESNNSGYFVATVVNDECIGCTNCATVCPDVAITVER